MQEKPAGREPGRQRQGRDLARFGYG